MSWYCKGSRSRDRGGAHANCMRNREGTVDCLHPQRAAESMQEVCASMGPVVPVASSVDAHTHKLCKRLRLRSQGLATGVLRQGSGILRLQRIFANEAFGM